MSEVTLIYDVRIRNAHLDCVLADGTVGEEKLFRQNPVLFGSALFLMTVFG